MLTALSTLLSFAALPLVLELTISTVAPNSELAIPVLQLMQTLSLFLLVILLLLIVFDQWNTVRDIYMQAALLALLFSGFAFLVAWGAGAVFGLETIDRYVLSVEFSIRNVGAAALVATSTLGRPEFVAFGALFVVFQAPLIALLLYGHRARQMKA